MHRRTLLRGALAGLTALPALTSPASAQQTRLRIGLITPPSHQWTRSAQILASRLKEESGGALALSVHPAGQLGNEAQMLQQLQAGALDFAFLTLGEFANRNADFGTLLAPYLAHDISAARALLNGNTAAGLLERTAELGLAGLGFGMAGMRQILLRAPAATGAELAGRKIRTVPLAQELDFWRKVGAAPTPLPLPALYDAMAQGQIDGMQIDFEGVWNSRYFELGEEMLASGHMIFPMVAVASRRRWATLSGPERALISGTLSEELTVLLDAYEEIDARTRANIEAEGFPVRDVGPDYFGDAIGDWYAEWREKTPLLAAFEEEAAAL